MRKMQRRDRRWMDLVTYLALGFMYVVGAMGLPGWGPRLAAAGLCLAFGLLHFLMFHRLEDAGRAWVYFPLQAALGLGLLGLRSTSSGAFGFLFFLLSIQAALILPRRTATGWTLFFFALTSLTSFALSGRAGLTNILFNAPVYFTCVAFGHSLRSTELARRQNQQLLDELRAAQDQLRDLAVAEERNRLAREMHDSLGHRLTVAVVQLEGAQRLIPLDGERAARMIGTMRDEMKEALAELRRTVAALRSPAETDQPLEAAVSQLARSFQASTGLSIHITPAAEFPVLPESYRLAFFRAAQEALTNVQRHAAAANVWLRLEADEAQVRLTVDDDGAGLPQEAEAASGSGLRGLRERAAALGGQLSVRRRPEGGTQIVFNAPRPRLEP